MRRAVLAAALALAACHPPEAKEVKVPEVIAAVSVETTSIELRKMPRYLTLTGTVVANRQSEVAANVAGRIAATHVERGQSVKLGQVLASVDSKAAGLSATAAAAQSRAAESQVTLAQKECDRADKLFAEGAMPKAEYDRVKTQCTAQLYSASAMKANAELAEKLAGDTVIRAPFEGLIGERYVTVGEYVQPPSRVASLVAIDPVRVQISIPEGAVGQIHEGQTLNVRVTAFDRDFPATVRYVAPALRQATRDLLVEALAPNADLSLRPGMFASVRLKIGEEEQPTVPESAVRIEGPVKRLFLVRNGKIEETVINTGVTLDGRVALLEKLTAAEVVVVRPPPGLRDGAPVKGKEADHAVAR